MKYLMCVSDANFCLCGLHQVTFPSRIISPSVILWAHAVRYEELQHRLDTDLWSIFHLVHSIAPPRLKKIDHSLRILHD